MSLQVFVRDDLVQTGLTEDGEPDIARNFYLVAEDSQGARWAHTYSQVAHLGRQDAAAAHLERLRARVAAHIAGGGKLDEAYWTEIDPCYGSEAYQVLDRVGYFRAAERARERDRGDNIPVAFEDAAIEAWEDRPISQAA